MSKVIRSSGATESERFLVRLAERTFLNLWSYPNVYRDQGKGSKGGGKEVSDLLVVCGAHVVVFSDKTVAFKDTGNIAVDWPRWYNRAILRSAEQLWGAERWLDSPERLYLDPRCARPFPINLPPKETRRAHLVVVARGAGDACKKWFDGGTGSLMVFGGARKEASGSPTHLGLPFVIGDIAADRSFVHVLDDATLELLLGELDTVIDFVDYLDKKAQFVRSGHLLCAGGEDDLLAYYVGRMDSNDQHNFTSPSGSEWKANETIVIPQGQWSVIQSNPQYLAKKQADVVSELWDRLINAFTTHMLAGTTITVDPKFDEQEATGHSFDLATYERAVRYMALESRFRRRILAANLVDAIERANPSLRHARIMAPGPGSADSTAYVFLQYPVETDVDYATYRKRRRITLYGYCMAVKSDYPSWKRVVGIATEPLKYSEGTSVSEDLLLIEPDAWSPKLQEEADRLRSTLKIMEKETLQFGHFRASEYPDVPKREAKKRKKQPKRRQKS